MMELLEELLVFLEAHDLNSFLISLIISIVGLIVAILRTGKNSIQKKAGYVNLNNFHLEDYVLIFDNLLLTFNDVKIKKKKDLTKLEKENLIDKGGVFNVKKKDEA